MASLLELAQQGDPGTLEDEGKAAELKLLTPRELYLLWESQQWSAGKIDFSADRGHWQAMPAEEREPLIWNFSQFSVGEERVATAFAPFVGAAEDLDQEAFLSTQLVDEVRHMVFFDRFYQEVIRFDTEDGIEPRLERTRQEVNADFLAMFDGRLMDVAGRLRDDPSDTDAFVEGITLYHMIIEGALALTGQHYLIDYLEKRKLLPGFVEGFSNVARDEHRHLAFGTWYLQQKYREDPRHGETIQRTLVDLLPLAQGVMLPPGVSPGEDYEILGYSSAEVNEFAFKSLSRRLKAVGVGLPGVPA